jgi:DNA-binding NtrC family response regulator
VSRQTFSFTKGELERHLKYIEYNYLVLAMDYYNWDYDVAAIKLGISRSKLYAKSKEFKFKKLPKITLTKRK